MFRVHLFIPYLMNGKLEFHQTGCHCVTMFIHFILFTRFNKTSKKIVSTIKWVVAVKNVSSIITWPFPYWAYLQDYFHFLCLIFIITIIMQVNKLNFFPLLIMYDEKKIFFSGCWGLTSFLISVTNLHINFLKKKGRMNDIHTDLSLKIISVTSLIVAIGATFGKKILRIKKKVGFSLICPFFPF